MPRESIWTRPESTGVGRPQEHSRAEITAAAIAIAVAEGLSAVTMRRVAREIGTGAASLYRYVATRDELVDLMIDAALAERETVPPTGDWRADLEEDIRRGLVHGRRHPWLRDAVLLRGGMGPNAVRLTEHTLMLLADHPATGPEKMEALGVINGMVTTFALYGRSAPDLTAEDWVVSQVGELFRMASDGHHPHLAAALSEAPHARLESADEMFVRVINKIVDALLPM